VGGSIFKRTLYVVRNVKKILQPYIEILGGCKISYMAEILHDIKNFKYLPIFPHGTYNKYEMTFTSLAKLEVLGQLPKKHTHDSLV